MWKLRLAGDIWIRLSAFLVLLAAVWLSGNQEELNAGRLNSFSSHDPGARLLFAVYQRLLLGDGPATGREVLAFELGLVAAFSAVSLLARVPVVVAVGGQVALLSVWLTFRSVSDHGHAVEAWAVVLSAGFLAALTFWRGKPWDYLTLLAYGGVLGYLPLMRQSALLIVLLPAMALVGFAALTWLARRILRRRIAADGGPGGPAESRASDSARLSSLLLPLAIYFLCIAAVQLGIVGWLEARGGTFARHGAGYPLFISLGFGNNPFNIAWDDDVAMARGLLVDGEPVFFENQEKLTGLWLEHVLEDPAVVAKGVLAKSAYLLRFFSGTLDVQATAADGYPELGAWARRMLGGGLLIAVGFCGWLFATHRRERMLVLLGGGVGLLLAGSASLLAIVPFYLGSAIACCAASVFVISPAAWFCAREERARPNPAGVATTVLAGKIFLAICVSVAVGAASFTAWRSVANREAARALLEERLEAQLQELRYAYVHRFNRLSLEEQRLVLKRLLDDERQVAVYRGALKPDSVTEREHLFAPILAFAHERVLFVACWMSEERTMTLPNLLQGPRTSVLRVLRDTQEGPGRLHYFDPPWIYAKIADANWDGRYRMFALPQVFPESLRRWVEENRERYPTESPFASTPELFHVGAFNFAGGSHMSGLVLTPVGEGRLVGPG